jgi:hypothetical protein
MSLSAYNPIPARKGVRFYAWRIAWIVFAFFELALSGLGGYYQYTTVLASSLEPGKNLMVLRPEFLAAYTVFLDGLPGLACGLLSLLIFWRLVWSQDHYERMPLYVAYMLLAYGIVVNGSIAEIPESLVFWQVIYLIVTFLGAALFFIFLLIFPDGRFRPQWTKLIPLAFLAWMISWIFIPALNPGDWSEFTISMVIGFWLLIGAAIQIYRYLHVSNAVERLQTKWVAFSLVLTVILELASILLDEWLANLPPSPTLEVTHLGLRLVYSLFLLLMPISIVASILRFRLWEIDSLIDRALAYSILSFMLFGVYLVSVIVLQVIFSSIFGSRQNDLVTAVSTLGIVGLFRPLRRQAQRIVDRRFYRRKYNTYQTLSDFGAHIKDEVDLHIMSHRLVEVIRDTMQPERVTLWFVRHPKPEVDKYHYGGKYV